MYVCMASSPTASLVVVYGSECIFGGEGMGEVVSFGGSGRLEM